ncbi:hypothetical protein JL721_8827 [Aureococcus anophagefferens]|nr:hypothetical protein JL721_8827 [Aureococcus anophagefferens]
MVHAEHARKLALLEAEVALLRLELEGRDIVRASGGLLPALLRLLLPVALAVAGAWGLPAFLRCVERKLAERHEGAAARGDLRRQALYRLDLWFSTNPYSKMQALAALAAALVVAGALLLFAVSDTTPTDALWESLAGVGIAWDWASAAGRLDPGSARGVLTRVVAVAVSLGGMFVTALLLGIVSEQITEKVEHYRKGKSDVLESGHTVILGWSDKLFGVLEQLCLANESLGGGVVVLLSDKPKEEQEDARAAVRAPPGLAQVWSMLLGFDGCEFYIKHHAELDGVSFGDAFLRFDDAVPIGVIQGSGKDATIWVNQDDLVLRPGDKLIVIAEDDDTEGSCAAAATSRKLPISSLSSIVILAEESEDLDATSKDSQALTTLLLLRDIQSTQPPAPGGARPRAATTPAKSVDFVCSSESRTARRVGLGLLLPERLRRHGRRPRGRRRRRAEPAVPRLAVAASVEAPASSLSPSNSSGAEPRPVAPRPDVVKAMRCHSSPTWSLLRKQKEGQIISEILDSRTSKLIADAQISDYVLSNDLVANALAMIAEDRTVNKLLKILMESEGSEFYIRRAADLVDVGRKQSFFDVMRAARLAVRGPEIAFGYVRAGEARAQPAAEAQAQAVAQDRQLHRPRRG